jgi:hypothetical protein
MILVMLTFPIIFCITHPSMEYRHPLDVIEIVFASDFVLEFLRKRKECGKTATPRVTT